MPKEHSESLKEIISNALRNSLTAAAIEHASDGAILLRGGITVVLGEGRSDDFTGLGRPRKIVWFGRPPRDMQRLGICPTADLPPLTAADGCAACTSAEHHTESKGFIRHSPHPLTEGLAGELRTRPFTRYDFTEEWNNLGFGRIRTDGSIWGVSGGYVPSGAVELSGLYLRQGPGVDYAGSYLTLFDAPEYTCLWCARPAGPVDSTEWTIIERFISDWRAGDGFPCLPSLLSAPAGCSAIATMRLDCDEDISSARDVFEWYHSQGLPLSLAVKTSLPMRQADLAMLRDVHAAGGTLLSHSHTHPQDWGGTYEAARGEAEASRQWFRDNLPEVPVPDIAVSPFHTNPPCALQGVEAAGFTGVVSGIIHNDPEYLLGRAGMAPLTHGLVTISQQSMLHGDCYAQQQETVDVHVQALDIQRAAGGIFGYLDHPFSERYQYGWADKAQRLAAHSALVQAIRERQDVWFWSQRQCFDFVQALMGISLHAEEQEVVASGLASFSSCRPACRFQGKTITL